MAEPQYYSDSPFLDLLGTKVEEWRDGYARISLVLKPEHLNRAGVVHGGVLATLLDHGGGFCGLFCDVPGNARYGMSLSLTCNFISQTRSGRLEVIGRRTAAGTKIYFAETKIVDGDGATIATGSSVHRFRSGSESSSGVPKKAYPASSAENG